MRQKMGFDGVLGGVAESEECWDCDGEFIE